MALNGARSGGSAKGMPASGVEYARRVAGRVVAVARVLSLAKLRKGRPAAAGRPLQVAPPGIIARIGRLPTQAG